MYVKIHNKELVVEFVHQNDGYFKIDENYLELMNTSTGQTKAFLKNQLRQALFLKKSIYNRNLKLEKVVRTILNIQKDFFIENSTLLPLSQKEVANLCNLSPSTVSRICSNRFLQSEENIYLLKDLFSHSYGANKYSKDYIVNQVLQLINEEDKKTPFSDREIVEELSKKDIYVSRRVISKYRGDLKIPNKYQRKKNYCN